MPESTESQPIAPGLMRNLPSFYIGYHNAVPRPLARFLMMVAAALLVIFAAVALLISRNVNDPGNGDYDGDVSLKGTIIADPAPILRIPADDRHPPRAIMLGGEGKTGVQPQATALSGKPVTIAGTVLRRGSIDMLVTAPGSVTAATMDSQAAIPTTAVSLGRWRLTGEICDGKCNAGAMRPGNGLAHKACANLCILGGVPPVFVSTSPVDGTSFFLLTGIEGASLPANLYDLIALQVEIEGEIVRLDDLLILRTDLKAARRV